MTDFRDEMDEAASRIEREARRDAAMWEAEGVQHHRMQRTLTLVVFEAMQQGRRVRVRWPGGELAGLPIAAVEDLVVLRTRDGEAAVQVPVVASVEITGDPAERGAVGDRIVTAFRPWCQMVEGRQVTAHAVGGHTVDGRLVIVARDHLLIDTGRGSEVAVAFGQVAALSVVGDAFVGV